MMRISIKTLDLCQKRTRVKKLFVICVRFRGRDLGEMLEWLKRHAWKACKPLKGFAGSNPALSAMGIYHEQINNKIKNKKRIINLKN